MILSQKFDLLHLGAGAAAAAAIAVSTQRLIMLPPPIGARLDAPMRGVPWLRILAYVPWLTWQVVLSAVQVAQIVLRPRLRIDPQVRRFRGGLPHTIGRLTLANSITLTPGTVTLDVVDDEFLVHALTPASAAALEDGSMQARVARVFKSG